MFQASDIEEWLAYISKASRIDLGLDRMHVALTRLALPHKKLPPILHIAGTNGKGSVLAICRALLRASGLRVYAYSSPHLTNICERFDLHDSLIATTDLWLTLQKVHEKCYDLFLTHFEYLTLAAFLAFSSKPADVLILETGLGGRLDATNCIEHPLATAITTISYDHMELLGETLPEIAREKAGILKSGVPCAVGRMSSDARKVIESVARMLDAPLQRAEIDWFCELSKDSWTFSAPGMSIFFEKLPFPVLSGRHQIDNAGMAIMLLSLAGFTFEHEVLCRGLQQVSWPGRLQAINVKSLAKVFCQDGSPLPEDLPQRCLLDGAHNSQGAAALADFITTNFSAKSRNLLIMGIMKRKNPEDFLSSFDKCPFAQIYCVTIPDASTGQSFDSYELSSMAAKKGVQAVAFDSVEEAVHRALKEKWENIVISGSLYLVGYILRAIDN